MKLSLLLLTTIILIAGAASRDNGSAPEPTVGSTATPVSSPLPTATATLAPTAAPSRQHSWQYPGSTIVKEANGSLVLTSHDSADVITKWYEDKVEGNYGSRSIVRTSTNGEVLNVISAARAHETIKVEITLAAGASIAEIKVALSTD